MKFYAGLLFTFFLCCISYIYCVVEKQVNLLQSGVQAEFRGQTWFWEPFIGNCGALNLSLLKSNIDVTTETENNIHSDSKQQENIIEGLNTHFEPL